MDGALLALALWAGAAGGVVAAVLAVASRRLRRVLLLVAAVLFLPIGVLGILSVGVVFLAAALACVVAALLTRSDSAPASPSPGASP